MLAILGALGLLTGEKADDIAGPKENIATPDLAVRTIERNVTIDDWMRRSSASPADYRRRRNEFLQVAGSRAGLRIAGELANVEVSLGGVKRTSVAFSWAIYDARTQERTAITSRTGWQDTNVHLRRAGNKVMTELWMPPVPVHGPARPFYVRVEMRDADGALLAVADSKPFLGLR